MPGEPLTDDMMKVLMTPEQYANWKRQQDTSREFWRTLQGPAQRPLGSNADEWNLFLAENTHMSTGYFAVQIAEAIEEAERRGYALGTQRRNLTENQHSSRSGGSVEPAIQNRGG